MYVCTCACVRTCMHAFVCDVEENSSTHSISFTRSSSFHRSIMSVTPGTPLTPLSELQVPPDQRLRFERWIPVSFYIHVGSLGSLFFCRFSFSLQEMAAAVSQLHNGALFRLGDSKTRQDALRTSSYSCTLICAAHLSHLPPPPLPPFCPV